jgi:hypothetical protein
MQHLSLVRYIAYWIVTTSLLLAYPARVSSEDIADGISGEESAALQAYDPDSLAYYFDPGI